MLIKNTSFMGKNILINSYNATQTLVNFSQKSKTIILDLINNRQFERKNILSNSYRKTRILVNFSQKSKAIALRFIQTQAISGKMSYQIAMTQSKSQSHFLKNTRL